MLRMRDPLTSLINTPAAPRQKLMAIIIGSVMFVISLISIPFASTPLIPIKPFMSIIIAWVMFGYFMTSYLLYIQFQVTQYKPILILSATFLYSGLITIPEILTFPGVFAQQGLLNAGPQSPVWFWICWHAGFPLGIFMYAISLRRWTFASTERKGKAGPGVIFGGVIGILAGLTYLLTKHHEFLPVIIQGGKYHELIAMGIGPVLSLMNLAVLVYLYVMTRGQSLLHLWLLLSVFMFFLDLVVTQFAGVRYSLGWYVACVNSLISSTVVLFVFFHQMNRLYVRLIISQSALKQSQERVAVILDSITDAFFAVDRQWGYTYMNKAAEKYSGFTFDEIKGQSIWTISPHLLNTKLYHMCHQVMEQAEPAEFTDFDKLRGRWLEIRVYPSRHGISMYYRDVTDRIVAEEQMREANKKLQMANRLLTDFSYTDGLTGVYNRRYFDQMMQQEWERMKREKSPLSLIMLDIDYFKKYNDTYGHLAGDECLCHVAQAIRTVVIHPLYVMARYGGEEFGIILPQTNAAKAIEVAEAIRIYVASLAFPHVASKTGSIVTCSLGTATWLPENTLPDHTPSMLIAQADQALYMAKQAGRNRVVADYGIVFTG
ncbi:diguanylate cyclase domain-containing protein [Paenibacillus apiarius]|uniref:diguanylate cyclase domain-containing protein n=1 Tax=Paenibacillus apiarius TaxID=46240 RepID=UPI003B3A6BAE